MSDSWHSYPSIFALGHKALERLFAGQVIIEEKIDGSQFSFCKMGETLRTKSKGQEFVIDAPPDMFQLACETVYKLAPHLHDGWTYRAEYLSKPKHNTLAYNRTPHMNLIIFDINDGHESYLPYDLKVREATRLGLEVVPILVKGEPYESFGKEYILGLLNHESILGGVTIEGIVVKNYSQFGPDKHVLMGKFVSEHFKEIHGGEWRKNNPPAKDIIQQLIERYKTPARWEKSVQHLKEEGRLLNAPQDIGPLMKEIPTDIKKECEDEIKSILFHHYWPHIVRGVTAG